MKHAFLFLALTLFSFVHVKAQDSLAYTATKAIVANQKMNVAYIGLDNPLEVSYPGSSSFILKCDQGKIRKDGDQYYLTELIKPGLCRFTLTDLKGKNEMRFVFRVKHVPAPTPTFANKRSNAEIGKDVLYHGCLIPILEDFDFTLYYKVLSYEVLITRLNNDKSTFIVQDRCLSREVKECILALHPGDRVLFRSIKCQLTNSNTPAQELDSLLLTIK